MSRGLAACCAAGLAAAWGGRVRVFRISLGTEYCIARICLELRTELRRASRSALASDANPGSSKIGSRSVCRCVRPSSISAACGLATLCCMLSTATIPLQRGSRKAFHETHAMTLLATQPVRVQSRCVCRPSSLTRLRAPTRPFREANLKMMRGVQGGGGTTRAALQPPHRALPRSRRGEETHPSIHGTC